MDKAFVFQIVDLISNPTRILLIECMFSFVSLLFISELELFL